jgi:subtilase family serine protease
MTTLRRLGAAAAATVLGAAANAAPYPSAATPAAIDRGAISDITATASLTVALKLSNEDQIPALIEAIYTPGGPEYGKFISPQEFSSRFGPSASSIAQVTRHLEAAGFTVSRSATAQLTVTGSSLALAAEFGVELHDFEVPATAGSAGYHFRAPTSEVRLSPEIAEAVRGVFGFDTRPRFRPHLQHPNPARPSQNGLQPGWSQAPQTADPPGDWTVVDFDQYYDVVPLYQHGITGKNRSLGIVTLASFHESDAFAYWHSIGLNLSHDKIHTINVDGGAGPPSDAAGSDETTLDVEQSGGVAPDAQVFVYVAPNTDQGFLDALAKAVDSNVVDTLSTSWGDWEWLDAVENPFSPPDVTYDGHHTSELLSINDTLTQAALQGQSAFDAAGDDGSYDANDSASIFPLPQYSLILAVDDPAAQPYMTAVGGTTLAGPQVFDLPHNKTLTINIPAERAWSWDYLNPLCAALHQDPATTCGTFPVGGGGGVSSFFALPFYQDGVGGITTTAHGQQLIDYTGKHPKVLATLPSGFHGRNVPDISVNADPDTGYILYYTSDQTGFGISDFNGGTSFAAPQLNGVTALLDQGLGHRVGLLNVALYQLLRSGNPYSGHNAPLRDIVQGNNEYYKATPGYDQASGVGVPDVAHLLGALQALSN